MESCTFFIRNRESPRIVTLLVAIIVVGILTATYWNDIFKWVSDSRETRAYISKEPSTSMPLKPHKHDPFNDQNLLKCNITVDSKRICSYNEYPVGYNNESPLYLRNQQTCPDYFRWMFEDLRPWIRTGISESMVEHAKSYAHFRLIILDGRVYVERYKKSYQTRDILTIWGIVQLVRKYPGRIRDLDLMFNCFDTPPIWRGKVYPNISAPPPVFGYCTREGAAGLVFPDWSFWGWPEINIMPWESMLKVFQQENEKIKWLDRKPYAFWKGNPHIYPRRLNLLKCNVTKAKDWNARIYNLNWNAETRRGFKNTNLANQCDHRYKIYVEGNAWSVSQKYILACDSLSLLLQPQYLDFFSRGLIPMQHYWPITNENKDCPSIKYAVDWGNTHHQQAESIGKAGSRFIQEEVKIENVYDYMFHLLNEYAGLLKYRPIIPPGAHQVCVESMACPAKGRLKKSMIQSMVKSPSKSSPCRLH